MLPSLSHASLKVPYGPMLLSKPYATLVPRQFTTLSEPLLGTTTAPSSYRATH